MRGEETSRHSPEGYVGAFQKSRVRKPEPRDFNLGGGKSKNAGLKKDPGEGQG